MRNPTTSVVGATQNDRPTPDADKDDGWWTPRKLLVALIGASALAIVFLALFTMQTIAANNARSERSSAVAAEEDAEKTQQDAENRASELRERYDPQVQADLAALDAEVTKQACTEADAAGYADGSPPTAATLIQNAAKEYPQLDEFDDATSNIDVASVNTRIGECFAAGKARKTADAAAEQQRKAEADAAAAAAEAARVASLTEPKGNGLWTVGLEMAAGVWRSSGGGSSCYWERHPDGSPDDIIDNHYGSGGGTVTVRDGEEFETADCGTWSKVG